MTVPRPDPNRYIKDAPPRVFDVHVHFPGSGPGGSSALAEEFMIDMLAYTAGILNIQKIALLSPPGQNREAPLRARDRYPDLFLPMAWVVLDEDEPELIHQLKTQGYVGLKFHSSLRPYDAAEYFPIYQAAEEEGLVCLFHTGIAGGMVDWLLFPPRHPLPPNDWERQWKDRRRGKTYSANGLRPALLDTIAQAFPDLIIIGAHLGYGFYDEATAVARWRGNVSFDISGGSVVRRHILERGLIRKEILPLKLCFGSDCGIPHISRELSAWMDAFNAIGLTPEEQDQIFFGTAARLFGIE
ncbi:MAG: amidohydrolase family protein [Chloroflexi bacterium]|nr:amidohydrolase family protein [Chloroflexota bacterium]